MNVGERIKLRRHELHLTQAELGKKLGWGKSAVCRIEREGNNITTDRIKKIAIALECSPADLMGWTERIGAYVDIMNNYKTNQNWKENFLISDEELEILEKYRRVDDEFRKIVKQTLDTGYKIYLAKYNN